jgi:sugar lactone lactonase YvrE
MSIHRLVLAAILLIAAPASAEGLGETLTRYQAAMQAGDAAVAVDQLRTAQQSYENAQVYEPQLPQPYLKLATVMAKQGDRAKAIALLDVYAGMNKLLPTFETDFTMLKGVAGYDALAARFRDNAAAVCRCKVVWHADDFFIAEGIAHDGDSLFAASVKTRRIVRIAGGVQTDFATLPGTLAPFGILVDRARHRLLVSAAELRGNGAAPEASALLIYDLVHGALLNRIDGPKGAQIGDVALASDGTIYLSDSRGAILRVAPNATAMDEITHDFISPQGMVVSADGKTLLVADYTAGLMRLDLATHAIAPVDVPRGLTTVTMDGLQKLADGTFVGTQNNIAPVRIVHFALSDDWSKLTSMTMLAVNAPEASDPSLITTDGEKTYTVGIAQWGSLDDDAVTMKPPLLPWTILELTP